jgi:hypothetical protein
MSWLSGPASNVAAVTPSDTTVFDTPTRGLLVVTAGDIVVVTVGGQTVTIVSAATAAGQILPLRVTTVKAATTAVLMRLW